MVLWLYETLSVFEEEFSFFIKQGGFELGEAQIKLGLRCLWISSWGYCWISRIACVGVCGCGWCWIYEIDGNSASTKVGVKV